MWSGVWWFVGSCVIDIHLYLSIYIHSGLIYIHFLYIPYAQFSLQPHKLEFSSLYDFDSSSFFHLLFTKLG